MIIKQKLRKTVCKIKFQDIAFISNRILSKSNFHQKFTMVVLLENTFLRKVQYFIFPSWALKWIKIRKLPAKGYDKIKRPCYYLIEARDKRTTRSTHTEMIKKRLAERNRASFAPSPFRPRAFKSGRNIWILFRASSRQLETFQLALNLRFAYGIHNLRLKQLRSPQANGISVVWQFFGKVFFGLRAKSNPYMKYAQFFRINLQLDHTWSNW